MNPDLMKAFFIVTRHHVFFSKVCHYADDFILRENGFKDWQRLYDFDEGFCCVQYRPFSTQWDRLSEQEASEHGVKWRVRGADYSLPFEKWKFNIRHQPSIYSWPRWVNVGKVHDRTFPLLPEWARHHIIRGNQEVFCPSGYARLALENAQIHQSGGMTWAFQNSQILQDPNSREGLAFLFDDSHSAIYAYCMMFGRSRAVVYPGSNYQIFDQAKVEVRPGLLPKWGQIQLGNNCFHGENLPFNLPVESM